jgi:hypothetical protein
VLEFLVQELDLVPVAWLSEVQVGDRCLDRVRAAPVKGEHAFEELVTCRDLALVPQRAILVIEQNQLAAAKTQGGARVVDEHKRQQAVRFGFVWYQFDQGSTQADPSDERSTRPPPQPSLKIR